MKINALITCVDNSFYADCLEKSLPLWRRYCETVTVVTDLKDERTPMIAHRFGAILHRTDIFYDGGRIFGKSAAMEEARVKSMPYDDWILFADADVLPPVDWMDQVEKENPVPWKLYGCKRVLDSGKVVFAKGEIAGYFMLFHSNDPLARFTPLLDPSWVHAGNYDSEFSMRWPAKDRVILPMVVRHFGPDGKNWCGRGNDAEMEKIRQSRTNGKSWRNERIDV